MVIVVVEVTVKPERLDDFLELIKYDAEHSENDEPGCLRFDVLQDTEHPDKYYFYECYKDDAARLAHRETPHFKKWAAESPAMFSAEVVRRFTKNIVPSDDAWR